MNNRTPAIVAAAIVIAAALLAWWAIARHSMPVPEGSAASNTPAYDQSISDGLITIPYSSSDFGLAVNAAQLPAHSYIPPCDPDFNYCFYYNGTKYQGTNFESAGVRVKKRADLGTERLCLNTPPAGFDASMTPSARATAAAYSSSVFRNVNDAAAGHYANGSLERLYVRDPASCYEFEARIGETQFANYPAGSIKEFTAGDRASVYALLANLVQAVRLPAGESVLFPDVR